jgi:hypothetical protein
MLKPNSGSTNNAIIKIVSKIPKSIKMLIIQKNFHVTICQLEL